MNTETNAAATEPTDPLIGPVDPDLKSERVQDESTEPEVEAG